MKVRYWVGAAIVLGIPILALGQMTAYPARTVTINGTPTVTIALPDGGTQLLQVEGRGGGPLLVTIDGTPTFELGAVSATLLAGRTCVYGPLGHNVVDGGVQDIPGMVGRTGVQLVAHDFGVLVDYVSCWPGQPDGGGAPNCTLGADGVGVPIHERGSTTFDLSNAYTIRCLACTHSGGAGGTTAVVSGANSQCTP